MIAYVYWKGSLGINCIINNVTSISGNQIIGDTTINFGGGSNYVILQNPINKNIGDEIDLEGLEDERNYFIKGNEVWMQEKINKLNNTNTLLSDRLKTLETIPNLPVRVTSSEENIGINEDTLNSILVDILPQLMTQ